MAELQGSNNDTVIHLGAAIDKGSYEITPATATDTGKTADSFSRGTVLSFRTENRGLTNAYRAQVYGDTGLTNGYGVLANNNANISKNLQGLEVALASGGLKFQSEFFDNTYGVSGVSCAASSSTCSYPSFNLKAQAIYYEFMYNLTGESWANSYRSGAFTTVKPKVNFSTGSNGGWGAWQVGLRYSEYRVTEPSYFAYSGTRDGVYTRSNIATSSTSQSRGENSTTANTVTYGVNWILNPNSRILFNYANTRFNTPTSYLSTAYPSQLGTTTREQVLSVRSQVNF